MSNTASSEKDVSDPVVSMGLPSPLILGSGSFTRKLILGEMNVAFHKLVRSIDESSIGDRLGDPQRLVLQLAEAKGDRLVEAIKMKEDGIELPLKETTTSSINAVADDEWIVLTADQVVTHNGIILEKPINLDEAKDFVSRYAHSPPSTVGACVLTHVPSQIRVSGVDSARIRFQPTVANANLIDRLIENGAPVLDCAGGLMVEHPFVKEHIEGIDGTEDSVMGLSKDLVLNLLHEMRDKLKDR